MVGILVFRGFTVTHLWIHLAIYLSFHRNIFSGCDINTAGSQEHGAGYLLKVMMELKSLKPIIVFSVGFSILAVILLSYWSSTFTIQRLDVKYVGRKTLHL